MADAAASPKRVLVVEDDEVAARTVLRVLGRAAYEARSAATAAEAREAATSSPPDVVLLDRRLPDGDGVDLAVDLRQLAPGSRLVMLSGDPLDDDAAAHVDAWLLKPASIRDLLAAVAGDG